MMTGADGRPLSMNARGKCLGLGLATVTLQVAGDADGIAVPVRPDGVVLVGHGGPPVTWRRPWGAGRAVPVAGNVGTVVVSADHHVW